MDINPYASKYPGAGGLPQANPADGGRGGIGADTLGIQFRDWTQRPILARIMNIVASTTTGYLAPNQYGYVQLFATSAGTATAVAGGIATDGTTLPAFEMNGNTLVPTGATTGAVVEMWPQYSTYPAWTFLRPSVVVGVTCIGGELAVTRG